MRFGDGFEDGAARNVFGAHVRTGVPDHAGQQVHKRDVLRLQGVEPVDEFVGVHERTVCHRHKCRNVKIKGRVT